MLVVCLSILILFFGIFSVSASDNTDINNDNLTNIKSNTYDDLKVDNDNQKLSNFEDEKLNAGNEYTFDDLQSKIDAAYASGVLNLDSGDFYNNTNSKAITISQTLTINGNGATISGANGFTVSAGNVVLKNIKFIYSGAGIHWNGVNGVLSNCSFVNITAGQAGAVYWTGDYGVLNNCSFDNINVSNRAGAVYWTGDYGVLGNCSFVNNTSISNGGAVYWNGANGVLSNCTFVNCSSSTSSSGGAVSWNGRYGVLSNCSFVKNSAPLDGGAVYWYAQHGVLKDSIFYNNTVGRNGGAVSWNVLNGTLMNCFFVNNTSKTSSGAVFFSSRSGTVSNCTFIDNVAGSSGGLNLGGDNATLRNCYFVNNTAKNNGGAVVFSSKYGVLTNCSFVDNYAGDWGGAIMLYAVCIVLGNCSFVNNSADQYGGAVFWRWNAPNGTLMNCSFVNNTCQSYGGAVYWDSINGVLSNCSFVNNVANYGGAVYWSWSSSSSTLKGLNGTLANCSFVNNSGEIAGAVSWNAPNGTLVNCSFVNSTARRLYGDSYGGGAVYWSGDNGVLGNCSFINSIAYNGGVYWSGLYGVLGNCSFVNNSAYYGGGVYWSGLYGVLGNCSFVNNNVSREGGGVYWSGANGVLCNCSFVNNTASQKSGGVYWFGTNGTLSNCSFVNNTSINIAGAVYWSGQYGVLSNCSFVNNRARNAAGAVYMGSWDSVLSNCIFINSSCAGTSGEVTGGAVHWYGDNGVLSNCSFVNNNVSKYGGAVYWSGQYGVLGNCSFVNNTASYRGGAVFWYGQYSVLGNCSFVNNTASDSGGAVYCQGRYGVLGNCSFVNNVANYGGAVNWGTWGNDNATLTNCSFVNNTANNTGGAVYCIGPNFILSNCSFVRNVATNNGGAIVCSGQNSTLVNCTLSNNQAQRGSAIYGNSNYFSVANSYFDRNLNDLGQGIYLNVDCNISNCRFDMTKIYINSGKVRLINNVELNYQNNFTTNKGRLFLSGNNLKSCIYNLARITSPVTMIALNNQTVKPSSNKIDVSALIYDDNKNIIIDDDLRISVGSTDYNAVFDGVNYTAFGCDVPETSSIVSVKIQRSYAYTGTITYKNGLLLQPAQNFTVNVEFDVVKNDVLMLFNVTPTSFNDNLTVFVANSEYSVKISDGKGNVSVKNLPAGNYAVIVYYPGNDNYNSFLHSFNFTVNLLPSQINITVGDYYAGSDVIIGVNLTRGASGLPIIYVDNRKVDYTALGDINLGKLAYGNHTVSVIYAGDNYYDSSFNRTDFLVKKINSTISLNIADGGNDASKNIIVEVTNGATGDVLIDVNGVVYQKTLSASKATLILDDLKEGNYTVVATYLGDGIYNSNSTSGSFEINATGQGNLTVNVTVIIDGKNYTGVIVDGVYNVDLSNVTPGIYDATVIYRDSNNNLINTTMTIAIPKWNSNVDVSVSNIRMGEVETIVVNVTRGATGTVLIDVNGTVYYKILDNSRAELVLSNLNSGNYPVRVIYMGDDKYNNSTNRAEFIVGDGVIVSVFMDGKNPMLDVIVPQDAVGSVTVTINNKDYSGVVDNRHAIINISDVAPNTYNITTSYTNTSGSIIKGNATITVPKPLLIATVISVEYVSKDLMVTSVLKDIDGNVLPNEEITYSMNGVINKTTTDREGLFKVKYVSNSTLYIEYAGNNVYEGSNTTIILDKFVDLRNATKIISEVYDTYAVDFELGERGGYFKFRLVDENGNALANKPVQIGFCGVVYNRVTDSEGNAQLQINLNTPFIFTFAIAFLGDDTHNASFVVQQINVVKKTTSISAASKSYKANAKTKKFTVTLKSDKCSSIDGKTYLGMNKKITLKVNGKTYTAKTNALNQATFKLSISKKGSYNAEIRFEGDGRYAASKTTAKIKII